MRLHYSFVPPSISEDRAKREEGHVSKILENSVPLLQPAWLENHSIVPKIFTVRPGGGDKGV